MAMLKPERLNISTSLGWSPMVAISAAGIFRMARQIVDDRALVGVVMGDVEVVRLRAGGRRPVAEGGLGIGLAALDLGMVVADADDLGGLLQRVGEIRHHLGLELDGPGLALDMRRLERR